MGSDDMTQKYCISSPAMYVSFYSVGSHNRYRLSNFVLNEKISGNFCVHFHTSDVKLILSKTLVELVSYHKLIT